MDDIVIVVENTVNPIYVDVNNFTVEVLVDDTSTTTQSVIWQITPTIEEIEVVTDSVIWQITPSQIITTGGTEFPIAIGNTPPENPDVGDLWLDTN